MASALHLNLFSLHFFTVIFLLCLPRPEERQKQVKEPCLLLMLRRSQSKLLEHLSTEDEGESLTDDEVSFPSQGNMVQQMRTRMDLLVDLSH